MEHVITTPPSGWVCRWPVTPVAARHWCRGDDRVSVLQLSEQVMGVEQVGNMPVAALEFVRDAMVEQMERPGDAHMFWDSARLEGYDREVRDDLFELLVDRAQEWTSLHVLFGSPLIGMTVSTVGLSLGDKFLTYRAVNEFFAAVERILRPR